MEKKYKLSDVGNMQVIDMLKGKISAGATKIRRYKERELSGHQKNLFAKNKQKQFYHNLIVVVTFQINPLMFEKFLNFGIIFG